MTANDGELRLTDVWREGHFSGVMTTDSYFSGIRICIQLFYSDDDFYYYYLFYYNDIQS